jgi:site-specific recombinase XerD
VAILDLSDFLTGKAENTRKAYRRGIHEFFELWGWRSPEQITVAEAAYYKKWLRSRELSDATICLRLIACLSYFDFLVEQNERIKSNPFRLVTRKDCTPTPYGRSAPAEWLDFEKVLRSIPDDLAGKRDKALLIFIASTGQRRAEVVNLKVKHLSFTSNPKTYMTKGGSRELSSACHAAILDHWISANRLKTLTPESAVFGPVDQGDDPHRCLTVDQLRRILKRNAQRAGVDPRRFKLHGLRHMDGAGDRLQEPQAVLGRRALTISSDKLRGPASAAVQRQLRQIRAKAASEALASIGD